LIDNKLEALVLRVLLWVLLDDPPPLFCENVKGVLDFGFSSEIFTFFVNAIELFILKDFVVFFKIDFGIKGISFKKTKSEFIS